MSAAPLIKKFVSKSGIRIYRISCPVMGTLMARVYLLLEAGVPTLLDSGDGTEESTHQILAGIEAVRDQFGESVRATDIRRIIITHGHVDHIGGLSALLRIMPAEVAVHPLDQLAVTSFHEHVVVGNSYLDTFLQHAGVEPTRRAQLLRISHFVGTPVEGVDVSIPLVDGQELDGLRIIHTPGHSPGHICIAADNILFSGDHILSQTVPQQWPESTSPYTGLGHYIESLDKIERLDGIELTLAAHEQVIHDLRGRIASIRGAHQRRLGRMLDMLAKAATPLTLREIADELYPETTGFRAVLAITDVGSRVEYLYGAGRLRIVNLDEIQSSAMPVYRYVVNPQLPLENA